MSNKLMTLTLDGISTEISVEIREIIPTYALSTASIWCNFSTYPTANWTYENEYTWTVELDDRTYTVVGTIEDMISDDLWYEEENEQVFAGFGYDSDTGVMFHNQGWDPIYLKITSEPALPEPFVDSEGNPTFITLPNGFEVTLGVSNIGNSAVWTPDGQTLFISTTEVIEDWDEIVRTKQYAYNSADDTLTLVSNPALDFFDDDQSSLAISPDGTLLVGNNKALRKVDGVFSEQINLPYYVGNSSTISPDNVWIGYNKLVAGNYVAQYPYLPDVYVEPDYGGTDLRWTDHVSPNMVYLLRFGWAYEAASVFQLYLWNNGSPILLQTKILNSDYGWQGRAYSTMWYPGVDNELLIELYIAGGGVQTLPSRSLMHIQITGSTATFTPKIIYTSDGGFPTLGSNAALTTVTYIRDTWVDPHRDEALLGRFAYDPATDTVGAETIKTPLRDTVWVGWENATPSINPVDENLVAVLSTSGKGVKLYRLVDNTWTYIGD